MRPDAEFSRAFEGTNEGFADTAREMKFRRRLLKRILAAAVRHKISKRQEAAIKFIRESAP
jgi:hypothetical protein